MKKNSKFSEKLHLSKNKLDCCLTKKMFESSVLFCRALHPRLPFPSARTFFFYARAQATYRVKLMKLSRNVLQDSDNRRFVWQKC